ncbi:MAG TPA: hypothetical protein VLY03_01685 [Bacteroidota bacterium]|nr:hypothetical protein [Bacteroidota bacterium]
MAERKTGKVIYRRALSPVLEIFRLAPEEGSPFPDYKSGQFLALSRDNCRLTKKIPSPDGSAGYTYEVDEQGQIKRGTVTHSYSIASAPTETRQRGYLEFYVVLELIKIETPGRLSESLFEVNPEVDNKVHYINKITGEFTLEKRAAGSKNIIMVGTGTGLAPFASMMKQLYYDALDGTVHPARFTLFHANRTLKELGYHDELRSIEASEKLDFVYVPSVSRPGSNEKDNPHLGFGRANNVLRSVLGMPLQEEELAQTARREHGDTARADAAVRRAVEPRLPRQLRGEDLRERIISESSVILACGNPLLMGDVRHIAGQNSIRVEMEEW